MNIRTLRKVGVPATLLLLTCAASARADVDPADRAMAEALFRRAKELLVRGDVAEACPKFAESQRIDPQLGTLLYLATCHEQEKKTASAWAEFNAVLAQLARVNQPDREKYARERMASLQKRLSRLVIIAPTPVDGFEVRLDGKLVGAATIGMPIPMDPGEHRIEAAAPNMKPWSQIVAIGPGPSEMTVSIPSPVSVDASESAPTARVEAPAPLREEPGRERIGDDDASNVQGRTVGYIALGAGVVGVAVGVVFGLQTIARKDKADDEECRGALCTQRGLDLYSEARTASILSTVGFASGAVGLGVGTFLVLHFKSKSTGAQAWVSPAPFGARLGVRW